MAKEKAEAVVERDVDVVQATEAILRVSPHPIGQRVQDYCKQLSIQPWQLLVGHLLKADQRGELHAPLLLPEWTESSAVPSAPRQKLCPSCKRVFKGPDDRPDARFCCNFCGSGRFQLDQVHHPKCEFFILPTVHLSLAGVRSQPVHQEPPTDPGERLKFEQEAFDRHLREVEQAEQRPGGLPPIPDVEQGLTAPDNRQEWARPRA